MRTERIYLDGIETVDRMRPLRTERVAAIKASINEIGLRTPLTVMAKPDGDDTRMILVAGNHRLAALRELGIDATDCFVIDDDEIDAKLWEIDENLIRASLSPTEEAEHLARRKELWEVREAARIETGGTNSPTSLSDGRLAGPQHKDGFAKDTAEKTGQAKRVINRKIERANSVSDEARSLIKGTNLDKGTYLDSLKGKTIAEQVEKVRNDLANRNNLSRRVVKVADEPLSDEEASERQYAALVAAWNKAGETARHRFRELIDEPVMDRRFA